MILKGFLLVEVWSQILYNNCDEVSKMKKNNIQERIKNYIEKLPRNKVYSTTSFRDFDNYDAVRKALSRLTKEGKLLRVARGFYKPSEYSEFLGEEIAVDPAEVAKAYACANQWTIAPFGDTALNLLGLTTQVPAVYEYVSDGRYMVVVLTDGRKIEFKHKTNREISGKNFITATVIEAINAIGKDKIDDSVRERIRRKLTKEELKIVKKEASTSRNWIYEEIIKL